MISQATNLTSCAQERLLSLWTGASCQESKVQVFLPTLVCRLGSAAPQVHTKDMQWREKDWAWQAKGQQPFCLEREPACNACPDRWSCLGVLHCGSWWDHSSIQPSFHTLYNNLYPSFWYPDGRAVIWVALFSSSKLSILLVKLVLRQSPRASYMGAEQEDWKAFIGEDFLFWLQENWPWALSEYHLVGSFWACQSKQTDCFVVMPLTSRSIAQIQVPLCSWQPPWASWVGIRGKLMEKTYRILLSAISLFSDARL